ncbi:MAG: hypothetical protein N4A50_13280 [Vallitalea sp.]|jgi:hypothetical protein|nr:hypothetical protein [Vallitalea sp.]
MHKKLIIVLMVFIVLTGCQENDINGNIQKENEKTSDIIEAKNYEIKDLLLQLEKVNGNNKKLQEELEIKKSLNSNLTSQLEKQKLVNNDFENEIKKLKENKNEESLKTNVYNNFSEKYIYTIVESDLLRTIFKFDTQSKMFVEEQREDRFDYTYRIYFDDVTILRDSSEVDTAYFNFDDIKRGCNYIAYSGENDARIRKYYESDEVYDYEENKIREILNQHGLDNTPIIIKEIYEIDIDVDNDNERIVLASNIVDEKIKDQCKKLLSNKSPAKDGLGIYDLAILFDQDENYILSSHFESNTNIIIYDGNCFIELSSFEPKKEELETNTIAQIIEEFSYERYLYLRSSDGIINLYPSYTMLSEHSGVYKPFEILDFLDVDNDNIIEIIVKGITDQELAFLGIYDIENNDINKHIKSFW